MSLINTKKMFICDLASISQSLKLLYHTDSQQTEPDLTKAMRVVIALLNTKVIISLISTLLPSKKTPPDDYLVRCACGPAQNVRVGCRVCASGRSQSV